MRTAVEGGGERRNCAATASNRYQNFPIAALAWKPAACRLPRKFFSKQASLGGFDAASAICIFADRKFLLLFASLGNSPSACTQLLAIAIASCAAFCEMIMSLRRLLALKIRMIFATLAE
jgi:hypothetical protein